ncbi:MAG: glycoside hydrolase family 5 protein [Planctomycetaceae bacterium]|nr:glycoside hydrolase family 5 protein [Planctomycetaceae bacterium]
MKSKIKYITIVLFFASLSFAGLPALKAKGTSITDGNNTVILKGTNLGNWLMMETWMMHLYDDKIHDQYMFELTLQQRFGEQEKNRLMDLFRANWINTRDFETIKSFNMNCARLPFYYQLLEDDNNPMQLKTDAFKWLDYAIDSAQKHGIYTILCLHGAAGCQSNMGHCGRDNYNKFWSDPNYLKRTCWLWQQIAQRYKNRGCVAGYDLLNEPWGAPMQKQIEAFEAIYKAIRSIDSEHIIFIQGHESLKELGSPREHGWENVAYSLHRYPGIFDGGPPTRDNQTRFLKSSLAEINNEAKDLNVPFFMGEFNVVYTGAGGAEMMRRHYDTYAQYNWAATMWAYKIITVPDEKRRGYWEMVTNKLPQPWIDFRTADINEIEKYFEFFSSDYAYYEDLEKYLTQKEPLPPLADPPPPAKPITSASFADKLIGWDAIDIKTSIAGGQKVYSDKKIDLYGCGADIYLANDQCRFVYKKMTGDCEFSATIDELTFTHMFAKAGIMIRDDLTDDSVFSLLAARPAGELEFISRFNKGEYVKTHGHLGHDFPGINLKLVRKGNVIESYHCKGNEPWEKFMTVELPQLGQTVYVGIFCLSHDNSQLAKAAFDNIK